jgi:uncharacterized membrane protein YbhN (UPF0104 family)
MHSRKTESSRGNRILLNAVAISVIVGVFGFLGWRLWLDRELLRGVDWWSHPGLWLLHFGLLAVMFGFATIGWIRIVRILGGDLSASAGAFNWLASNLGKYIPGKLFMLAGRVELARRLGVRPAVSMSALALEHVFQLVAASPFLLWALFHGFRFESEKMWLVLVAALVPAAVFVVRPSLLVTVANLALRVTHHSTLEATPGSRHSATLLGVYFTCWLAYGISGVVLTKALGFGPAVPVVGIIAAFVAAWMIGFLSLITPGGIGVREAVLVLLLGTTLSTPQAITVALLARLSWTMVEMVGVVIGLAVGRQLGSPDTAQSSD